MTEIPNARPIYGEDQIPVFVGREEDLISFYNNWMSTREETSVIKIANMPGIGKTEVIKQFFRTFGSDREPDGKGNKRKTLQIHINCKIFSDPIQSLTSVNESYKISRIIRADLEAQLKRYFEEINKLNDFHVLSGLMNELISEKETFWNFLQLVFNSIQLKDVHRLFFYDEIQTLYGKGVKSILSPTEMEKVEKWMNENPDTYPDHLNCNFPEDVKLYQQGWFRKISYLISNLISPKTIIFASGTQYSILNSLTDLGSPLQGRVITHNLSRLSKTESKLWIESEISIPKAVDPIWSDICELVIQMSGGIPRILGVYITNLKNFGYEKIIKQFKKDFEKGKNILVFEANKILDESYISKRLDLLFARFGKNIELLISRMGRHFLFHDYCTEEEIQSWINSLKWKNTPHPADLVEAGLLLRANGNIVDDYTNFHAEEIRPNKPLIMVSKHVHNVLRERFIDRLWLDDIGISDTTLTLMKMSASVLGFAFELYFARKIMQLSQTEFKLIHGGKSHLFTNIQSISLITQDLVINPITKIEDSISLRAINDIKQNTIYLLSQETAIDGFIPLENMNILYQCKYRKIVSLSESFFANFQSHMMDIEKRTGNPVISILFTRNEPTKSSKQLLNEHNILFTSNLELILGTQMVQWLDNAKNNLLKL